MTPDQATRLEADLEKRGYKKWNKCLIGTEDYAYFKSFGVHTDKYGDQDNGYQIAFRFFECDKFDCFNPPQKIKVWITVTMIPSNLDNRIDLDYSLQLDVPDIDLCEKMMNEVYEVIKKYEI